MNCPKQTDQTFPSTSQQGHAQMKTTPQPNSVCPSFRSVQKERVEMLRQTRCYVEAPCGFVLPVRR